MKRIICILVIFCHLLTGCAANNYQNNKNRLLNKAQAELNHIDKNCQKKEGITEKDLVEVSNHHKALSKIQYNYLLCYSGAKYVAFENYFEDKSAWKSNLRSKTRTIRSLYHRSISKKLAESLIKKYDAELQAKENLAVANILKNLDAKDKKGRQAVLASLVLATVVVAAAAVASGGGYGNSYSGYSSSYSGNCPCPYSIDAAGNQCGARSAWSRSGGASPQCY